MEEQTIIKNQKDEGSNGNGHKKVPHLNLSQKHKALKWERKFGSDDPYSNIQWEKRTAKIVRGNGDVVFEQRDVEVPAFWSQTATDIVSSKYFKGQLNSPQRENSARQIVDRVADTISGWGWSDGYFQSLEDYENFKLDMKWLLINQYMAFNSPVWFNVGIQETPQCSACFILSVEDTMGSILKWVNNEGWIFKGGSGAGINLSTLRSSKEPLSKGGFSSGPVSFMKAADGVANATKSGGTTRRAAKMVILNADHPDIKDFIYSKKIIEDMTKVLQAAGIEDSIEANIFDPYALLPYQNANNSVRVEDNFMKAIEEDAEWQLKSVTTSKTIETLKAREVMDWIADATWHSADPGIQFDTTINKWHTCPNSGRINASNPCSEYMHLDNSACNLASINLLKYLKADGNFSVELFKNTVDTIILAQEIIVGNSYYPTEEITQNANDFRQLGLGYANLGALLMAMGLPYDSEEGRAVAGSVSSLMSGEAYLMSARIAQIKGPFAGYMENREAMLRVIQKHARAADKQVERIQKEKLSNDQELMMEAKDVWRNTLAIGQASGYRNSQATVLAPTGTISFLMDCATTGIEPDLALVKYKKLVGGGTIRLINHQVPAALRNLGYNEDQIEVIGEYILDKDTIEGAPELKPEHLSVFDCSFKAAKGTRSIGYMGHLKMMSMAQPFISGAISKTVNLPEEITKEEIRDTYIEAWKMGLKSVALYRDGSKTIQPMSTKDEKRIERVNGYTRAKLPDERASITHKFSIAGHEGYLTVGLYEDGRPGETFIVIAKEGSTVSGLFDTIATLFSMCLQSGVPLKTLVHKFKGMRFEPAGVTSSELIPMAKSFIDYIVTYIGHKFLSEEDKRDLGLINGNGEINGHNKSFKVEEVKDEIKVVTASVSTMDAPICGCGAIMIKAGACYTCPNCFATTGVCN
jgi:ribonucleoside-diphosphate reductase alpha chain